MGTVTMWDRRANLLDGNCPTGANKSSSSPGSSEQQARARAKGRTCRHLAPGSWCALGSRRVLAGGSPRAGVLRALAVRNALFSEETVF